MTVTVGAGKKRAAKLLRNAGNEFIAGFLSAYNAAIPLRSKEPGLCWKASGQVAFAAIAEFCGPNSTDEDAPVLLRLRTNSYPPPAIYYHLKSPAVRHKLSIPNEPLIATEPALEVTTMPDEVGKLGAWLTSWLDCHFYQRTCGPSPPIPLVAWGVREDLSERKEDFTQLGPRWRTNLYLWSPRALEVFEPWLSQG